MKLDSLLTLTLAASVYNLRQLLDGTVAGSSKTFTLPYGAMQKITFQNQGPGIVYIGQDNTVSSTNYGIKLLAGDSYTAQSSVNNLGLNNTWFKTDTNATKLNVEANN